MRVAIDAVKCQGHSRCYALAPELFDVDDFGQAFVIGDGAVPAGLEDKARLAELNCPEFAIVIDPVAGHDRAGAAGAATDQGAPS